MVKTITDAGIDLVAPVQIVSNTAGLVLGCCKEVLALMPDNSVDAIVSDPPYGLSFMGKHWDYDVPDVETWAECLRVLKPGGHLLAFAGTRTQHRMCVNIEDAGFEIRDMIAWVYSSGFPKSMNLDRLKGDKICGCHSKPYTHERTEEIPERHLHPVRDSDVSETVDSRQGGGEVLQQSLPKQSAPFKGWKEFSTTTIRAEQSGVEGWGDASPSAGELRAGAVCESTGVGDADGEGGRLCNGTPASHGNDDRSHVAPSRGGASHRPQSFEQLTGESGTPPRQPHAQTLGAWPVCGRCGKPHIPPGLGTALKPALEPITVARKPFKGTVAENVLQYGTGAINVDGCRVTDGTETRAAKPEYVANKANKVYGEGMGGGDWENTQGRWPANLIHDGSEEVVALAGEQARFFYCAKASKRDRDEGLDGFEESRHSAMGYERGRGDAGEGMFKDRNPLKRNSHPTVKPTDLMRYLCRLVTPPGGLVLDPFMGSGSTGKAAVLEGFQFIGIEREAEYIDIAAARILHAVGGDLL